MKENNKLKLRKIANALQERANFYSNLSVILLLTSIALGFMSRKREE